MKKLKFLSIFLIFAVTSVEIGCKGDVGSAGPTGPSGPSLIGNITGLVTLIDTNGVQPNNKSGVSVSIPGTNKSVMTDSTGHWALDSISTGTYEIDISKNTYGSTKHINQQLVGGGTIYIGNDFLSETPHFTVSNLTDTLKNGFVKVGGSLSFGTSQNSGRNILIFIGTTANVNSSPANYLAVVSAYASDTASTFTINITNATFNDAGIGSGVTAYIIAYPASAPAATCSRYVDLATGRFIYTSLGSPSPYLMITTPMNRVVNNNNNSGIKQ